MDEDDIQGQRIDRILEHREAEEEWMKDTKALLERIANKLDETHNLIKDNHDLVKADIEEHREIHQEGKKQKDTIIEGLQKKFPGKTKEDITQMLVEQSQKAMEVMGDAFKEMMGEKDSFQPYRKERRVYFPTEEDESLASVANLADIDTKKDVEETT